MGKSFLSGNKMDFLFLGGKMRNNDLQEAASAAGEETQLAVLRRAALVGGGSRPRPPGTKEKQRAQCSPVSSEGKEREARAAAS